MTPSDLRKSLEEEFFANTLAYKPWKRPKDYSSDEQDLIQQILIEHAGAKFGSNAFVARDAKIATSKLRLGKNSWIAGGAIVRGNVTIGSNSSINPYTHVAGRVTIGSGVRIGGSVAIMGFNHGISDLSKPIYKQALTSIGITIGDYTWIGANAVILDGCTIGDHCIVAGGAVVTKSFPDYQIIGGNPARAIRDRRTLPNKASDAQVA